MKPWLISALFACAALKGQDAGQAPSPARSLADVHRIYVEALVGGAGAQALRELIIANLNSTGLFILTDDPKRADATLRGAADDSIFTNSYDSDRSVGGRVDAGIYGSGARTSRSGGGYGGSTSNDRESYRIKERRHEAYAAVRLVNSAGDTLWSTTQESQGAKFRSASTDVATKIARQIAMDMGRLEHSIASAAPPRP